MESYCNSSGRKLEFGGVRRHRKGKGKNRKAKERGSRKAR